MFKKYTPWIVLGILVIGLVVIGIKACNDIPDVNLYELRINDLEKKLYIEKNKSDSAGKKAQKWEALYLEEAKKPKKIIIRTNEKVDSIKHLPINDALKYHSEWTKLAVPGISE